MRLRILLPICLGPIIAAAVSGLTFWRGPLSPVHKSRTPTAGRMLNVHQVQGQATPSAPPAERAQLLVQTSRPADRIGRRDGTAESQPSNIMNLQDAERLHRQRIEAYVLRGPATRSMESVETSKVIDEAIASPEKSMWLLQSLSNRPYEDVVPKVIAALNSSASIPDQTRAEFYHLLFEFKAAGSPEGFDAIMKGLESREGASWCALALRHARPEKRPMAAAALGRLAADEQASSSARNEALSTLAFFGQDAAPALSAIEPVLLDATEDLRTRQNAASAYMAAVGASSAFDTFQRLAGGPKVYLTAVIKHCGEAGYVRDQVQVAGCRKLRTLVLGALDNEDAEVRRLAIMGIGPVFGQDLTSDREVKAAVRSRLTALSQKDPDPSVRKLAEALLHHLDSGKP